MRTPYLENCRRKLEQIRDAGDPKMPYVGIMIWWLEKHTYTK
jgi:hypothetical protein